MAKSKPIFGLCTVKISDLKEYHKNPRILTEKTKRDIKNSLDRFGLIEKPIVNTDMTIIGGHQRVHILKEQGITEIDCWIPDRELSDKEIEELNIRLNKNHADWDWDCLANEWDTDEIHEWGFSEKELGLETEDELDADEKIDVPKDTETVVCPKCGHKIED